MHDLVMVIDDDTEIRETLCELLEDEGYRAVGMANGRAALDHLAAGAEPPCLILLDLMMPVMDGWQFRAAQRAHPDLCKIPVVVITAAGSPLAAGVDAAQVLLKPLRIEQVLGAVEALC